MNITPARVPKERDEEFKVFDARPQHIRTSEVKASPRVTLAEIRPTISSDFETSVSREAEAGLREIEARQEVPLLRQFAILARMLTFGDMSELCAGVTGADAGKANGLAAELDRWAKEYIGQPPMPEEPK